MMRERTGALSRGLPAAVCFVLQFALILSAVTSGGGHSTGDTAGGGGLGLRALVEGALAGNASAAAALASQARGTCLDPDPVGAKRQTRSPYPGTPYVQTRRRIRASGPAEMRGSSRRLTQCTRVWCAQTARRTFRW